MWVCATALTAVKRATCPACRPLPQDCGYLGPAIGKCSPGEAYKGLWEVPLYTLQAGGTTYGISGEAGRQLSEGEGQECERDGEGEESRRGAEAAMCPSRAVTLFPPCLCPLRPDYGNTENEGTPAVADMAQLFRDALDERLAGGRAPLQVGGGVGCAAHARCRGGDT